MTFFRNDIFLELLGRRRVGLAPLSWCEIAFELSVCVPGTNIVFSQTVHSKMVSYQPYDAISYLSTIELPDVEVP
jgi:hypothetical protein